MNNEEYGRTRFGSVIVSTYIIDIPGFVIFHLVISFFAVSKHLARTSFSLSPPVESIYVHECGASSFVHFFHVTTAEKEGRPNQYLSHRLFVIADVDVVADARALLILPPLPSPPPPPSPLPPSPPLEGRPSMRPHRIRVRTTEHLIVRLHCGTCIEALPVETSLATI